ncbi:MAG: hypothetical protein ACFFCS_16970 [Candidatus Hodarchaeota archaeon]
MKINKYAKIMIIAALMFPTSIFFKILSTTQDAAIKNTYDGSELSPSVINSDDLYSEQMQFFLAGDDCLVRQSAITTDAYILDQIPLNDIAFKNATLIIVASNGIYPLNYVDVYVPFNELLTYQLPVNGFIAYLAYNDTVSNIDVASREKRAKQLLESAFEIEFFSQVTSDSDYNFMYYGATPSWSTMLGRITNNLPKDGFFNYLDIPRISNPSYTSNNHVSAGLISIDPYGGSFTDFNITGGIDDIMGLLDIDVSDFSDFMGVNFTELTEMMGGPLLEEKTTVLFVQYEGKDNGVTYNAGTSRYTFDLKAALGMGTNEEIQASSKVWNSMMGGMDPTGVITSLIDVNVISGKALDWDFFLPNLTISDSLIDLLYLASIFMADDSSIGGIGGSLEMIETLIKSMSLTMHFEDMGASSKLYTNINISMSGLEYILGPVMGTLLTEALGFNSFADSPLLLMGFTGIPFIPVGLLNPFPNLRVEYHLPLNPTQPNLIVEQVIDEAIKPFGEPMNLLLNVKNVGDEVAWGLKMGEGSTSIGEATMGMIPGATEIRYEVRAFYIPINFGLTDPLVNLYGIENILIDVTSGGLLFQATLEAVDANGNGDGFAGLNEIADFLLLPYNDPLNYLEPGDFFTVNLSDYVVNGIYAPFTDETAAFNQSYIMNGTEAGTNATLNNYTYAQEADGEFWDIESEDFENVTGSHEIKMNFTFSNDTSNLVPEDIAAIQFQATGFTNVSVDTFSEFYIWNITSMEWINLGRVTSNGENMTVNQTITGSFRIVEGDLDTQGNVINLTDFLDDSNNYSAQLQYRGVHADSMLLSLDYLGMDYLQENETVIPVMPKTVTYTDLEGNATWRGTSNSLYIGSINSSVLTVDQDITNSGDYTLSVGSTTNMTVNITNVGTEDAIDVNISIPLPGIVTKPGMFEVGASYLNISGLTIAPGNSSFYTFEFNMSNSIKMPGATVAYNNVTLVEANVSDYVVRAQDLYLKAPVDYDTKTPMVITVNSSLEWEETSTIPVNLGNTFNITVAANPSILPSFIPEINLTIPETTYFNISSGYTFGKGVSDVASNITIEKLEHKGYLVPSFMLDVNSSLLTLMRFVQPRPLQVGSMELSIEKIVIKDGATMQGPHFSMTRDEEITVVVMINNTGTLPIGIIEYNDISQPFGLQIIDNEGFEQYGFNTIEGVLMLGNITLNPNQSISFNYTLVAKNVGTFTLGLVAKDYLFIHAVTFTSNEYSITVNEKPELIAAYLGVSIGIVLLITIVSLRNKKKQKRAFEDFVRRDKILYDEIRKTDREYEEYLD